MKNAHIIIAHPNAQSFNHALKDQATAILTKHAYQVSETDLYQAFDEGAFEATYFGREKNKDFIKREQKKFKEASLTILQFPLYWFSYPAILKNYVDHLFEKGFAYPGTFENAPLRDGRKLLLSITTQSPESAYQDTGNNGDIIKNIHHMFTAFRFIGYDILPPFIAYEVTSQDTLTGESQLERLEKHIASLIEKPSLDIQSS